MKKKVLLSIITVVTILFTGCTTVSDMVDDSAVHVNDILSITAFFKKITEKYIFIQIQKLA